MRLLYFSRDYTSHDYRFLSGLAKSGHQVAFLRLERQSQQFESRALPPEIEIITWSGGQAPVRLRDGPQLTLELRSLLRRIKPDLVQAGPLQRCAFLAALAGARPLVSMSWGYDLLIDARRSSRWQWATRFTLQHSAAMVGDCDTIRRLAVSFGMSEQRIVTFPWGIDLEHFCPSPEVSVETQNFASLPDRPFTLLSTRNWEPIYGVDVLARAFVLAARQRPELRLVMLGNGSQAGLLRQIFLSEGLLGDGFGSAGAQPPRVIFAGQVSYADLPHYYRSADLYISTSHSDGSSISLLEAMACGTPALVSDIPGNREWVTAGENGWLFADGDAQALARAILTAVDERQRLPEMGSLARRITEQRADWNKNFPLLFRAYELALQRPA